MPEYLSPGVYVEEVRSTPPIIGVGTSTAAFIGAVDTSDPGIQMPLKPGSDDKHYELVNELEPRLVTNFAQFTTLLGDFQAGNSTLAHAVYGFFNNGGSRCYVVRVSGIGENNAATVAEALTKLESIDEIAIVAVPGAIDATVQLKIIDHCEKMLDRFAIIDGQLEPTEVTVLKIKGGELLRNSQYAALYFPWLEVYDPVTKGKIYLPPAGHMAGVYARVDSTRGVHKAPANEYVRGITGLKYPVSKNEQNGLNPAGINVIRSFNGSIKVWGARTLGGKDNGEFMYINVRRLFNFIRESIDEGTQFAVFEPNAQPLWHKIRRSVTAFLTNIWRDGALFGNTPEEAFYVKCDETTNPPEVRELGQVVTEIGIAVAKPAEFVIFRISQMSGS